MDLAKSMKGVKGFEKIVNWIKKVPTLYLPLFALPSTALVMDVWSKALAMDAPPGFDDFAPIHQGGFLQNLIQINKDCILSVDQLLHSVGCGCDGSSVSLSIFIWAAFLKLLTSPLYEKTLKYPAEFEKAV